MRSLGTLLVVFSVIALLLTSCSGGIVPGEHTFELNIQNRALTGETEFLVTQDDVATLNLTTDEPATFTIPLYYVEQEVTVGETATYEFRPDRTGGFDMKATYPDGTEVTLGRLNVEFN